jgi:hypothetical protein
MPKVKAIDPAKFVNHPVDRYGMVELIESLMIDRLIILDNIETSWRKLWKKLHKRKKWI